MLAASLSASVVPTSRLLWPSPAGNLPLLLCWPLLAVFALSALVIEKFGARLLTLEQRAVAASRKREVGYTELKRAAARRANATGELAGWGGGVGGLWAAVWEGPLGLRCSWEAVGSQCAPECA